MSDYQRALTIHTFPFCCNHCKFIVEFRMRLCYCFSCRYFQLDACLGYLAWISI